MSSLVGRISAKEMSGEGGKGLQTSYSGSRRKRREGQQRRKKSGLTRASQKSVIIGTFVTKQEQKSILTLFPFTLDAIAYVRFGA